VVERLGGLLFYPVQYEGLEQSPRIVYFGATANQQLLPAVEFLTEKLGKKRLFLVGSDYVFPQAAHAIIRDAVQSRPGVAVVGEVFIPLGGKDVGPAVAAIRAAKPDAIVNTINGSTNVFFFRELRAAGFTAADLPALSVSVTENELRGLDAAALAGDYLAATYFQSVDTPEGRAFADKFRARYGADRVVSDAMAAAYAAVHVWAKGVAAAGQPDPAAVMPHVRGQSFRGPAGELRVDPENQHVWQPARIGRIRPDGQVTVVAGGAESLRPDPYPPTRSRQAWERFLSDLYVGWDGRWQAPAKP
jgi:urea transport system substrate-binding protein